MTIGKALKCSFKWVVLEICSSIRLEVIIWSLQLSKMNIGSRLVQDFSNLLYNISHVYIKIKHKSFNWEVVQLNSFISLAVMSSQRCLFKLPPNQHQNSWALREVHIFQHRNHANVKTIWPLERSRNVYCKRVVLEPWSFIRLEVIICSWYLPKWRFVLRL